MIVSMGCVSQQLLQLQPLISGGRVFRKSFISNIIVPPSLETRDLQESHEWFSQRAWSFLTVQLCSAPLSLWPVVWLRISKMQPPWV